jgi:hypothetical protein
MDHSIVFTSISNTDDQRTSRLVTGIHFEKSRNRKHTKADLIFLAPSLDNFLSTPTATPPQDQERQHEQTRCSLYNLCGRRRRYQEDSRVLDCLPQLKQMPESHKIDWLFFGPHQRLRKFATPETALEALVSTKFDDNDEASAGRQWTLAELREREQYKTDPRPETVTESEKTLIVAMMFVQASVDDADIQQATLKRTRKFKDLGLDTSEAKKKLEATGKSTEEPWLKPAMLPFVV